MYPSKILSILLLVTVFQAGLSRSCSKRRLVTINPPTLLDPTPFGYSHITVDTKNAVAHIAGQVPFSLNGTIIGENFADQLAQVEVNIMLALKAVRATNDDIMRLNAFVVNFNPSIDLPIFQQAGVRLGNPVITFAGISSLALEGILIEIELDVAITNAVARKLRCGRL